MYEENDKKGLGKYVPLIKDSPVWPVIFDANRTVLSLPPIINGAHSAVGFGGGGGGDMGAGGGGGGRVVGLVWCGVVRNRSGLGGGYGVRWW